MYGVRFRPIDAIQHEFDLIGLNGVEVVHALIRSQNHKDDCPSPFNGGPGVYLQAP